MNKYVEQFLSLRCAGDVHNIVFPVQNMEKEITESMGMLNHLRGKILKDPMRFTLLDLCAGNALTSILGVHLLPLKEAHAFDIKPRERNSYKNASRFTYHRQDIDAHEGPLFNLLGALNPKDIIMIGVHPCGMLANSIIELAFRFHLEHVAVMPCCASKIDPWAMSIPFLNREEKWLVTLAMPHKLRVKVDLHILSPRRYILYGDTNIQ